jgi:hypothetical protein
MYGSGLGSVMMQGEDTVGGGNTDCPIDRSRCTVAVIQGVRELPLKQHEVGGTIIMATHTKQMMNESLKCGAPWRWIWLADVALERERDFNPECRIFPFDS